MHVSATKCTPRVASAGNGKFGAMMAILWRAQLWGLIRPNKQQKIGALL
jgi:hypothetical protein